MSQLEDELRATLHRHAANVDLAGAMPQEVRRRAHIRRTGTAGISGVLAFAAVALTVGVVRAVHPALPPQPAPSPPLPLVERVPVTPHSNGDLVYPVSGALVRRAPGGRRTTWVSRSTLDAACGSRDCSIATLRWSPDGAKLAVVMGVVRRTTPSKFSVYVIANDSNTPRKVFDCPSSLCSNGGSVSWSPDGSSIAVSDDFSGTGIEIIHVANSARAPRPVCADCQAGSVSWSPDGRWLAYASPHGIRRISLNGDASEQVDSSTNVSSLAWSPDGTRLLVERSTEVLLITLARRPYIETKVVTGISPGEGPVVPAWAPDGTKVSWFATPGKHRNFVADVWVAGNDGSKPTRLMHTGCCVSDWSAPLWSPDGTLITLGLSLDSTQPPDLLIIDAIQGKEAARAIGQGWGPMAWQPRS